MVLMLSSSALPGELVTTQMGPGAQELASLLPTCGCGLGPTPRPLARIAALIGSLAKNHDVLGRVPAGNRIPQMFPVKAL